VFNLGNMPVAPRRRRFVRNGNRLRRNDRHGLRRAPRQPPGLSEHQGTAPITMFARVSTRRSATTRGSASRGRFLPCGVSRAPWMARSGAPTARGARACERGRPLIGPDTRVSPPMHPIGRKPSRSTVWPARRRLHTTANMIHA
jgi:hypothetical protein